MHSDNLKNSKSWKLIIRVTVLSILAAWLPSQARSDETCNSPFMTNLIKGQEDYVYVWTLGVESIGDGSDKLVTIDVNPSSKAFGKVINQLSFNGRGEAHHMGFTEDRRHLWLGRLDTSDIFVVDVASDPAKPKLIKTIHGAKDTGYVGPHTHYALPGRMLVQFLSNAKDHGGVTGMALYTNDGKLIKTYPMPTHSKFADGYGYDIGINPNKNVLLTSSFVGWNNYMMNFGQMLKDPVASKQIGNSMVLWDLKSMRPQKVFSVPGMPLELRWSLRPGDNWAVTVTALTSKIYVIKQDEGGVWRIFDVATVGDPAKIPLPVDISISNDGKGLWVATFSDGTAHYFDISDPMHPKETFSQKIGSQLNMVSQSWDGKRVYFTSSALSNWDKKGPEDEQFLKMYNWDGTELKEAFTIDFYKQKLGRAHHMKFGSAALKTAFGVTDENWKIAEISQGR
ncbi:MAG: selenium-binding protein SBP56-related protein [Burkholderiales bacterium]